MTDKIRQALERMVKAFRPFTLKPMGAPGSDARHQQNEQIDAHNEATQALAAPPPEPPGSPLVDLVARTSFAFWTKNRGIDLPFEANNEEELAFAMAHAEAIVGALRESKFIVERTGAET